ncbi:ABC transporter permease [Corynebacterium sp. Marseille-P4321]|uniref:ABC transporter permease n=1 Tax=Corynebacterium sp. Marseille-P4321 TaxID=2736603 RepID=UPI00158B82C2|nr:ABC transporter permease [Corynebacterium sp. Marseille-P4321]
MGSTLQKVSLRNIAAHKLRLALTVLAVVLGTAFLSGALMFTNMLSNTFDSAVGTVLDDVDAVVRPAEDERSLPRDVVDGIKGNPDVERVNLFAELPIVAATEDEVAIQTQMGTSRAGLYYPEDEAAGHTFDIIEGSAPARVGEVLVNGNGAERYGIRLGEKLIAVDKDGRHPYTVVGFYEDELVQETSLRFAMGEETYVDYYTDGTTLPAVTVDAVDGVGDQELVDKLHAQFPELRVETGQALAAETSEQIRDALSFVSYFLIAFGLVGLLVGTFLIANTFSMIVAQRTKEFALLRALGASRGQITRSVSLESLVVGLIGSAIGVVAGMGMVTLIRVVMSANGMALPATGLGLSAGAVAVPLVVGTLVTVLSALAPARRAGQVRPVEAMRSSEASTPQPLKGRTVVGAVVIAAGIVAALAGMAWTDGATGRRAALVGVAAFAVIAGVFLAGPAMSLPVVPPLGRAVGAPFGAIGKLASTNTQRNPRRTATTAFALMLGIALVTVIGMLGASMKRSVDDIADSEVSADFVLTGPEVGSFPVPQDIPERAAEVPGVDKVVSYTQAPVTVDGEYGYQVGPVGVTDVLRGDPADLVALDVVDGTTSLEGDTLIAPVDIAAERGWQIGDTVEVAAPGMSPQVVDVTVAGLFEGSNILQNFVLSDEAVAKVAPSGAWTILMVGVNNDGSVSDEELRASLEEEVRSDIVVQVRSTEDMVGEVGALIDQMLFILYALLSLAVVVALLGIVNTLTLSVIERRQEIGMLRAVGARRGQVRTMVFLESVQMSVFGAVLGVMVGLGLGWAFLTVLESQGLHTIVIPWNLVATMLLGSVLMGLVAAIWPAQRAAKTPPLDAIAE